MNKFMKNYIIGGLLIVSGLYLGGFAADLHHNDWYGLPTFYTAGILFGVGVLIAVYPHRDKFL